jgi:hypothetical protein
MELNVPSDITTDHTNQYTQERIDRWGMAENGEPIAIQKICNILSKKLGINIDDIKNERYDDLWFSKFSLDDENNECVKGAPDYIVSLNKETEFLLFEIKIKAQEFRKTNTGGTTQGNSIIPKYGCPSYYIDIVPVLKNMNDFCIQANIEQKSFIISFIKEDFSEIRLISLAKINSLISDGWTRRDDKKISICKYGEGYGADTYLIPKDATLDLNEIKKEQLLKILISKKPVPN